VAQPVLQAAVSNKQKQQQQQQQQQQGKPIFAENISRVLKTSP